MRKCLQSRLEQCKTGLNTSEEKDNELLILYKSAHELYQSEVISGGKLYNRYVSDFLNSHTYTDRVDAIGKNEHKKNFHIMEELLTTRRDLVQKYFVKEKLCDSDFSIMYQEFNTTLLFSIPDISSTSGSIKVVGAPKPNFQCCFNSVQISLIAHSFNEVRLFTSNVSEAEVKALFACSLKHPLKSTCNRRVALFFDVLCEHKLISARWQHIIDKNKLILSSTKNALLNSSKLSTALNEAKQNGGCIYRTIELYVQRIATCEGI